MAGAGDFNSDPACLESSGVGLILKVIGGAHGHGQFGDAPTFIADEVFGLLVVFASCSAQHEPLLAGDVVNYAEFLECSEGAIDADDIDF